MSAFDPATYENMVVEGANETKSTPVPENWYKAMCDGVRIKVQKVTDKTTGSSQEKPVLEVMHKVLDPDPNVLQALNRQELLVRQDLWLDLTENGAVAMGPNQNLGLGRLREATNKNDPKKPFSFKMLEGAGPYWIFVSNKTNAETGDTFSNVTKTSKERPSK